MRGLGKRNGAGGAFGETGIRFLSFWRCLERVLAGLAAMGRTGETCRCVLAMGNSVAPVVHLVVAHHKDSECAAVLHRSGAECARDGEKLKSTDVVAYCI